MTDAANNVTQYAYDTENNLTGITDANGHETTFSYDQFGRVTRTNFPSTLSETYAYDANNNLTSKTDRKGQTIQYVYDALNRLTRKLYTRPSAFALNDYEGSDVSHPVLFTAPWTDRPVDLREKLIDFLGSRGKATSAEENHHVYFSTQRWLSGKEILCQVTGYGDVDPKFYKLGGGFRPYR